MIDREILFLHLMTITVSFGIHFCWPYCTGVKTIFFFYVYKYGFSSVRLFLEIFRYDECITMIVPTLDGSRFDLTSPH